VSPPSRFLWNAYKILALLFVPLIFFTASNDPLLAVFGAKQYLLFPLVGFATFLAFQQREDGSTIFRSSAGRPCWSSRRPAGVPAIAPAA
jgi:hypothetical protein